MSDWSVDAFFFFTAVDSAFGGTPSQARWRISDGVVNEMPPPIADGVIESFPITGYTSAGTWVVLNANLPHGDPGAVYLAPYSSGVGVRMHQIPVRGSGYFDIFDYPGGVVVTEQGVHSATIITNEGVVREEPIPVGPPGPDSEARPFRVIAACYSNSGALVGIIGASTVYDVGYSWVVSFARLYATGAFRLIGPIYECARDDSYALGAAAADVFEKDEVIVSFGQSYDTDGSWGVAALRMVSRAGGRAIAHRLDTQAPIF